MDGIGLLYAVTGSLALLFFFANMHAWGWSSPVSLLLITVGIGSFLLFIRHQLCIASPLLQLRLFQNRIFTVSIALSALLIVALYSGIYFIPLYLQEIHRMTPYHVGLLLLMPALTLGAATLAAGRLYERIGPLYPVLAGVFLIVIASWKFSLIAPDTGYLYIELWMAVRYIGIGLSLTPAMNAGMQAAPAELYAHASALINWLRQIFGALALGLFTSLFYTRLSVHTSNLLESSESEGPQWIHAAAYTSSIDDTFMVACFVALANIPLALLLRRRSKRFQTDQTEASH
jgi:hypothetical protein